MLLGEHEHSLDDKNRLTLPAKLRAAFEAGVVVTRGLDGCLYAYPRPAWEQLADRIKSLDPLAEGSRVMQRHFFAGAAQGELDKQGRLVLPTSLIEHAGLGREVTVSYRPDAPDIATVETGIAREAWWTPGAGAAFFLFGLAALIFGVPALTKF